MPNKMSKYPHFFITEVKREFKFLISEFNFELAPSKGSNVRFESKDLYLDFNYEGYSNEITERLGSLKSGKTYELAEVVETFSRETTHTLGTMASDRKAIRAVLRFTADIFRNKCGALLSGDSRALADLEKTHISAENRFIERYSEGPIREKAEHFWRNKNYLKVMELYTSLGSKLTRVELKRLEYAKDKISTQGDV